MFLSFFGEANRFGAAQFLRQRLHLRDQRIAAGVRARYEVFCVPVRHDAAVVIH